VKISFRNEREIKTFLDDGKLRKFVASGLILKEWLKGIFKKKKMVKDGVLEYKEGRKEKKRVKAIDLLSFLNYVLIIEAKSLTV
jgi:hypothetical protein